VGGASGAGGGAAAPDRCGNPDPGNNDAAHATPYTLGTSYTGCIQDYNDRDFLQLTAPDSPGGGYIVVTFAGGTALTPDAFMFVAGDPIYIFESSANHPGDGLTFWFAAAAAVTYEMRVEDVFGSVVGASYTFEASFFPVHDASEPNDDRATATPLALGTPIQALAYAGYYSDSNFSGIGWQDWYHVVLGGGAATVSITHTSPLFYMEAYVFNTDDPFAGIAGYGTNAPMVGTDLQFTIPAPVTPGNYVVRVEPTTPPMAWGGGSTPPSYATDPYTLVVTQ
jgi:hypothetical protein